MKNGNLAPTLHSLCLCMQWQGDTRSALLVTYCFCGINKIHLNSQTGSWVQHMHVFLNLHVCGWYSTLSSELSGLP